ncbi:MAG: glycerophosphodiester phosphodiesterase family protein [Gallionella sp.]|nr:glycerophosphodiester phosphodiesterase family protein [Gallionella sp.]
MTLIYAHRGANREAAENTRTAFDKALHHAIDGIETDVQLSRDGIAVLWHDDDLARLGLPDRRIGDFDHAQLRAMDFAAHFSGAAKEGVMTLADFVAAYRDHCRLLLEIKHHPGEPRLRRYDKVARTLACAGADDGRVIVSSFDLDSLVCAHGLAARCPLVLNFEPQHDVAHVRRMLAAAPWLHGVCVHIATLDEAMMEAARECGKLIAVYTCNDDEQIARSLRLGVDILISDVPPQALRARDA